MLCCTVLALCSVTMTFVKVCILSRWMKNKSLDLTFTSNLLFLFSTFVKLVWTPCQCFIFSCKWSSPLFDTCCIWSRSWCFWIPGQAHHTREFCSYKMQVFSNSYEFYPLKCGSRGGIIFSTKYGFRKSHGQLGNFKYVGEMPVLKKSYIYNFQKRDSAWLDLKTGNHHWVLIKNMSLQGIIIWVWCCVWLQLGAPKTSGQQTSFIKLTQDPFWF